MKIGEIVDYTKMRKNKRRRIDYCPECGRKGQFSRYENGGGMVVHTKSFQGIYFRVEDSCHFGAGELTEAA